jgi:hypothetical protein
MLQHSKSMECSPSGHFQTHISNVNETPAQKKKDISAENKLTRIEVLYFLSCSELKINYYNNYHQLYSYISFKNWVYNYMLYN